MPASARGRSEAAEEPEQDPASPPAKTAAPRRVREARLRLTHLDPWSVMKTSFLLSIALGIVLVVAVADRLVGAGCGRGLGLDQPDRRRPWSAADRHARSTSRTTSA